MSSSGDNIASMAWGGLKFYFHTGVELRRIREHDAAAVVDHSQIARDLPITRELLTNGAAGRSG